MKVKIIKEVPKLTLGEGLFWDSEYKKLWFVDIKSFMLYALEIDTYDLKSWKFEEEVCWVMPTYNKNEVILGLKSGVIKFDTETSKSKWLVKDFPKDKKIRLNDVGVDNEGRLWFGSMHNEDESLSLGELVSFNKNEGLRFHDKNYKVTNGPVISKDYLYHNDSFEGIIYRYKIDINKGELKNKKIFKKFSLDDGKPDGMCFDEDGNILVSMWGSGKINKIDNKGNIMNSFELAVPLVTNVCFGGKNFEKLFVTSANVGMSKEELKKYPDSGALFEIEIPKLKGKELKKVDI